MFLTAAGVPHYSFEPHGTLILSHEVGHVAIRLDMTPLKDLVGTIFDLSEQARKAASQSNCTVLTQIAILLKNQYKQAVGELTEIAEFYVTGNPDFRVAQKDGPTARPVGMVGNRILRRKRFVAAVMAAILTAVGAHSLFSSLDNEHLTNLKDSLNSVVARQRHLVTLLDTQDQAIRVNRNALSSLAKLVEHLEKVSERQSQVEKSIVISLFVNELSQEIRAHILMFKHAIEAASSKRLAFGTLTHEGAERALSDIRQLAAHRGLVPVPQNPQQLQQLECSFVPHNLGLTLIVHVPLTSPVQIYQIHRYRPFPIPITEHVNALYVPPKQILALSNSLAQRNNEVQFLELSHFDLESCRKIGKTRLCTNLHVANRPSFPSCLMDLYSVNHDSALKTCKAHLQPPQDIVLPLGLNKYLSYTTDPSTYSIFCPGNQTLLSGYQLSAIQELSVPKDCQLQLPSFILYPQTEHQITEPPRHFTWTKTPKAMFPLISPEHLEQALKTLHGIQRLPPTELTHVQTSYLLNHPLSPIRWPTSVSLSGVMILGLAFIILLTAFCYAYRKKTNSP